MRLVYVLGVYLKHGGEYRWQTFMKGDGSGTPEGMLRITIDVDHVGYWRTWGEVTKRKGWKP